MQQRKQITFDHNYPKGSPKNPAIVTVRQESIENNTLLVTLTKNVVFMASNGDRTQRIQKGDKMAQWVDPKTGIIHLMRLEPLTPSSETSEI
jgi:hypothetical protein